MAVQDERTTPAVRERVHEAAVRLFAELGVSATSLQLIADEVGVSKAAVYYHYRSKNELVLGVVTPLVDQLARIIWSAKMLTGRRAQLELVVTGMVDIAVQARLLYLVAVSDRGYLRLSKEHPRLQEVQEDLFGLLYGPDPSAETRVAVALFFNGLAGPLDDPQCVDIPDDELRLLLTGMGRKLLLARRPAPHA